MKRLSKLIMQALAIGFVLPATSLLAQTTIDANTNYDTQDYSGQTLIAGAANLGITTIKFSDLSNTAWSSTPTATPSFNEFGNQAFRGTDFTAANWSGVTFNSTTTTGSQFFHSANFTNANFSGTTFNLQDSNSTSVQAFLFANFSGADFSNATMDFGVEKDALVSTTFSSTTNFSGVFYRGGDDINQPASLGGANFSNANMRIDLNGTNLDNVNFQNTIFVASDGVNTSIRNSSANLTDFRGTDFTGVGFANWLESLTFDPGTAPLYDENTIFVTQNGTFDPVAAGWTLQPIPEPTTGTLLFGFGAAALYRLRRRQS